MNIQFNTKTSVEFIQQKLSFVKQKNLEIVSYIFASPRFVTLQILSIRSSYLIIPVLALTLQNETKYGSNGKSLALRLNSP